MRKWLVGLAAPLVLGCGSATPPPEMESGSDPGPTIARGDDPGPAAPAAAPSSASPVEPGASGSADTPATGGAGGKPSMSVTVASMDVDGLRVENLSCDLEEGGMLAAAVLIAECAAQKKALDACAPAGASAQVSWAFAGGAVTNAKSAGAGGADACIAGVMKRIRPSLTGKCSALIHVGGAKRAEPSAT